MASITSISRFLDILPVENTLQAAVMNAFAEMKSAAGAELLQIVEVQMRVLSHCLPEFANFKTDNAIAEQSV